MYVYVDGENHYHRTEQAVQKAFGRPDITLSDIQFKNGIGPYPQYPDDRPPRAFRVIPECRFFWDVCCVYRLAHVYPHTSDAKRMIQRAIYFTSSARDDEQVHEYRRQVRENGFEPRIIRENKKKRQQRENRTGDTGLLDKAKGVDIDMATRIASDAFQGNFNRCAIFTSDNDFIPIIRLIRQLGKNVIVCGFADFVGPKSRLIYEPDGFVDLGEWVRAMYEVPNKDSVG